MPVFPIPAPAVRNPLLPHARRTPRQPNRRRSAQTGQNPAEEQWHQDGAACGRKLGRRAAQPRQRSRIRSNLNRSPARKPLLRRPVSMPAYDAACVPCILLGAICLGQIFSLSQDAPDVRCRRRERIRIGICDPQRASFAENDHTARPRGSRSGLRTVTTRRGLGATRMAVRKTAACGLLFRVRGSASPSLSSLSHRNHHDDWPLRLRVKSPRLLRVRVRAAL